MELKNKLYKNIGIHVLSTLFTVDKGVVKVLLVKRTNNPYNGYWALPSGALYNNELLEVGAKRELKEKTGSPVIPVSVVEETGLRQLEDEIRRMFFHGELSFNDEVYITNARHKAALEEAKESLRLVKESINMGMAEDFFSIDLMSAYESLGRIVGESVGEDLVNEIFSKFCVGK